MTWTSSSHGIIKSYTLEKEYILRCTYHLYEENELSIHTQDIYKYNKLTCPINVSISLTYTSNKIL